MASFRRVFLADFGTKVLGLILALAVYVHVFSTREREMTYRVPIEVSPLPAGLIVSNGIPPDVRVRVRASGKDLLKLKTRRFLADIPIETPRPGLLQRPILGSDLKIPRGVRVSSVEVIEPRTLNLMIERGASKTIPVAVRWRGEPGEGRALLYPPRAEPGMVAASGPASRIALMDSAETEPVPLTRGSTRDAKLVTPTGVTWDPSHVTVRIDTDVRRERRFSSVVIELATREKDRLLWIQPQEADLVISGAASYLDRIRPEDIRIVGVLPRSTGGLHRVVLRAVLSGLAKGIPLQIHCIPDSISVRLQ
jgi:hypothetical protein